MRVYNRGNGPTISTDYAYRGIDVAFLENRHLRVMVLVGKGGDIVEFRDKRTDVDVLYRTPHNWQPPGSVPYAGQTRFSDHYPGGWQVNLPMVGYGEGIGGAPYGLHGESALIPFDATVSCDDEDAVSLRLSTELVRYPFFIERELTLREDESTLEVAESITNRGIVELEYMWQHHVALGPPLLGPAARLDVPAKHGVIAEYGDSSENNRLQSGKTFEWPLAPGANGETVDLTEIPPREEAYSDQVYALDFEDGWYALTNPDLDIGFGLEFPTDPFECLWYWQPFGGAIGSPHFGRNYNAGLEPATSYPGGDVPEAQRENGTIRSLGPGESVDSTVLATTYHGVESVSSLAAGTVDGER